ncbi:IS4 family transposase [Kaistella flava (ex Peng et al. 2021)]|uniref:IS4 family transposase n=4 Tax=Kaistella flava (ex Peng et al. 2021) TaxID=2038776 RepID=A0A7M2YDM7_9FLAO|nr:IS4 family transposase [Kaistella flava (ex Peng et al. 2021)]QOW11503.1 IS4 family transposase [Kaistella flava (ex Peng et al. 2021)]
MQNTCCSAIYTVKVPDVRIQKRIEFSMNKMLTLGSSIVNRLSSLHTEKIGFYRMLSNTRFSHDDLLEGSFKLCLSNMDTDHVLAIQDTTEFNYGGLKSKLGPDDPDIGPTGSSKIAGFFCHPMLIVNPILNSLIGFSSVQIYNRTWGQPDKKERKYNQIDIEEKESYRWIKSSIETKELLPENVKVTIIGDRENDIYEDFDRVPDERTNLLIRSRCDRNIVGEHKKLYNLLDNTIVAGSVEVEITGQKNRKKRTALIDVKFTKAKICAPTRLNVSQKNIEIYVIEATENPSTIPTNEVGISWKLLTTHKIENLEKAIECINWYKKRWLIEELFRVIKTKGFEIESSQLGDGFKLKKLLAMTLEVALQVMRLKLSLNEVNQKQDNLFNSNEIKFLEKVNRKIEGQTQKQKNPYNEQTLAWITWIIARIGGWTGYKSQGPPGYITIKNGLDRYHQQYEGFLMFSDD